MCDQTKTCNKNTITFKQREIERAFEPIDDEITLITAMQNSILQPAKLTKKHST
jgi:hypothetical protein